MSSFSWLYNAFASVGFTDPLHPGLAHMPIGLMVGALILGFAALIRKRPLWGLSAQHCLILSWLFLFPTVLLGITDWQHYYHGVWLFPIKVKIGLASFLFVLLSIGLILIFTGRGESKSILVVYVLSFFTVVSLGYFGGHLVFGGRSPAAPQAFQIGKKSYDTNCRACHPNGHNVIMPNLPVRGSKQLATFQTFDNFLRRPRLPGGGPGPMPDFPDQKISDQEAKALYDYVRQAFGNPGQP
jgi:uncharacterized membrane protein